MNTTSTPPVRAIFPIRENEGSLTEAALRFGVVAYPESNIILFEGGTVEYHELSKLLHEGVRA